VWLVGGVAAQLGMEIRIAMCPPIRKKDANFRVSGRPGGRES